jgi:hypothetical protein
MNGVENDESSATGRLARMSAVSGALFQRAAADERFARIRVQALDQGGRDGGSIDQEPFEVLHRLPAGAKTLTVTVRADGRKPAAITLERGP